jgi:ABC-2 type transport system permease protein
MIALIRAEVLKIRTMRMSYGLLATAVGLSAFFAVLEASRAGNSTTGVPAISTAVGLRTVTTVTGFAMLMAGVLGAIIATGEFRHSTATLTYLATPRRSRVLAAKAIAAAAAGTVFGLVSGVISTVVGVAFAAAKHDHLALGTGALAGHVAGAILGAALLGAIGVGIGSLVRSQIGAIIGIFAWAIIVESVVGGLFDSVRPYLPYTSATTLAGTSLGGAAFGPAHKVSGGQPLPFVAAAALLAGIALIVSLVAATTTVRRDVT